MRNSRTGNSVLDRAIKELADSMPSVGPLAGAVRITGVVLSAGEKRIAHGLGRVVTGYVITKQFGADATTVINHSFGTHTDLDKFLYLTTTGTAPTVDLLVF